jgi:acetoin utilization deacetylase AcuC-like enzyme
MLEDEDFVAMTQAVKQWASDACAGRIVSCMEGGYNLNTLGATVSSHVRALAEEEIKR